MDLVFEVYTPMLEHHDFFSTVDDVLAILYKHNVPTVGICFGWAWDKGWTTENVDVKDIMSMIKQHEQHTKKDFGENDVYISINHLDTELLFCHESDIHCSFNQLNTLVISILTMWKAKGLIHYIKKNKQEISFDELGL